jgi:hypothetical protein
MVSSIRNSSRIARQSSRSASSVVLLELPVERSLHQQVPERRDRMQGSPTADGSEAYIIGNPGKGLHAKTAKQFGYAQDDHSGASL